MIGDPQRLLVRRRFERLKAAELAPFLDRPTSFVADAQNGKGALDPTIKPLDPGMRFAGTALTINSGARDNLAVLAALDLVEPGDVLLIRSQGFTGAAMVGDIVVKIAKAKGVAAIVTDGAVRDVVDILPLGLPVFCAAVTPSSAFPSGPGEVGLPMAMGETTIDAGDLITGDRDGVIVVPRGRLVDVTARLEEVVANEAATQAKVDAGEVQSLLPPAFRDQITYVD
jgi:4-hydroxy-4-methyl-2-oxoglutarate aldolase